MYEVGQAGRARDGADGARQGTVLWGARPPQARAAGGQRDRRRQAQVPLHLEGRLRRGARLAPVHPRRGPQVAREAGHVEAAAARGGGAAQRLLRRLHDERRGGGGGGDDARGLAQGEGVHHQGRVQEVRGRLDDAVARAQREEDSRAGHVGQRVRAARAADDGRRQLPVHRVQGAHRDAARRAHGERHLRGVRRQVLHRLVRAGDCAPAVGGHRLPPPLPRRHHGRLGRPPAADGHALRGQAGH
mmetsp:Transcript_11946/g.20437  ORF Transcript_11946/g.20437 Transcript_11946/m.20437 type:complete len:245 (+) Transcript_11946:607-1341(+)